MLEAVCKGLWLKPCWYPEALAIEQTNCPDPTRIRAVYGQWVAAVVFMKICSLQWAATAGEPNFRASLCKRSVSRAE